MAKIPFSLMLLFHKLNVYIKGLSKNLPIDIAYKTVIYYDEPSNFFCLATKLGISYEYKLQNGKSRS